MTTIRKTARGEAGRQPALGRGKSKQAQGRGAGAETTGAVHSAKILVLHQGLPHENGVEGSRTGGGAPTKFDLVLPPRPPELEKFSEPPPDHTSLSLTRSFRTTTTSATPWYLALPSSSGHSRPLSGHPHHTPQALFARLRCTCTPALLRACCSTSLRDLERTSFSFFPVFSPPCRLRPPRGSTWLPTWTPRS